MGTPSIVFKVLTRSDWENARRGGSYAGSSDDLRDGFIHLSSYRQLAETLRKHFNGQDDLVLIEYDAADLGIELKWETSRGGDLFPHLYAALPTSLARSVHMLPIGAGGAHVLPEDQAT